MSCKSAGFQSWEINSNWSLQQSLTPWIYLTGYRTCGDQDLVPGYVVLSTNGTLGREIGSFRLYLLPLEGWHRAIPGITCLLFRGASATGWNPAEVSDGQPIRQVFMGQWGPVRPGAFWQSRLVFLQLLWKEQGERFLALRPG